METKTKWGIGFGIANVVIFALMVLAIANIPERMVIRLEMDDNFKEFFLEVNNDTIKSSETGFEKVEIIEEKTCLEECLLNKVYSDIETGYLTNMDYYLDSVCKTECS